MAVQMVKECRSAGDKAHLLLMLKAGMFRSGTVASLTDRTGRIMTRAGMWIDQNHAIIILLLNVGQDIHRVIAEIFRDRENADVPYAFPTNAQVAAFYDDVYEVVCDADSLLIMGTDTAKDDFLKRFDHKGLRHTLIEVSTSEEINPAQLEVLVRQRLHAAELLHA